MAHICKVKQNVYFCSPLVLLIFLCGLVGRVTLCYCIGTLVSIAQRNWRAAGENLRQLWGVVASVCWTLILDNTGGNRASVSWPKYMLRHLNQTG